MSRPNCSAAVDWLMAETHCSEHAARQAVDYIAAQQAALGVVPTQTQVVFERFFDDSGGMQLVVHAPFGGRINRAWGLAMRKRFCRSFDFELQATADDDGFILSLGPQHSFPIESLFPLLRTDNVRNLLEQALLVLPLFHLRWRWNVSRALQLERTRHGKKVPPALQRFRAEDLLTAVFPKLTGCQEEHTGDHVIPDHPLIRQTVDDALHEALDLEALVEILGRVERGEITFIARDTREPSPFAYELLNAYPYAFLDGGEIQERRARMVETQRVLSIESVRDLGKLDPAAIQAVIEEAQPLVRDADELHDLLLSRYLLPTSPGENPDAALLPAWEPMLESLIEERRAARVRYGPGRCGWVAAERWPAVQLLFPDACADPPLAAPPGIELPSDAAGVLVALLRGLMETAGPLTAAEIAGRLGVDLPAVAAALEALEGEGALLRGHFRERILSRETDIRSDGTRSQDRGAIEAGLLDNGPCSFEPPSASLDPRPSTEWCHRRLLQRIHRLTVSGLRREIEPVDVATYWRLLARRHGLVEDSLPPGPDGVFEVIGCLQGLDLPSMAWEQAILPARVADYRREWLDELCLKGEVGWGRLYPPPRDPDRSRPLAALTRSIPISLFLREDLPWLAAGVPGRLDDLSSVARQVYDLLAARGAMFTTDLLAAANLLPAQLDDVLGELVARGLATCDGFAGLRALIRDAEDESPPADDRRRPRLVRRRRAAVTAGRWSLWRAERPDSTVQDNGSAHSPAALDSGLTTRDSPLPRREVLEQWAWQLLRRWGVLFRDLLVKEPGAPPWWELAPVLRRMEMRGEIRGGRFIVGVGGEQYASGEVVQQLRQLRREADQPSDPDSTVEPELLPLSAADPLNLVGILTRHARVPSLTSHVVVYHRGVPVADVQAGRLTIYPECPQKLQVEVARLVGGETTGNDAEAGTDRHARRFASRKRHPPRRLRFPRPFV
jgi:ATP-dependent Lhr-like helicase